MERFQKKSSDKKLSNKVEELSSGLKNFFLSVAVDGAKLARLFVLNKFMRPNLMFANKVNSLPNVCVILYQFRSITDIQSYNIFSNFN